MVGIFGVVRRDDVPLPGGALEALATGLRAWAPDGLDAWCDGTAALGQTRAPVAVAVHPDRSRPGVDATGRFAFSASGRVDNRAELLRDLGVERPNAGAGVFGDAELLRAAYRRWGNDAPRRVLGDWSFAAWHQDERRLVLSRDHFGQGGLFYCFDASALAFAFVPQVLYGTGLASPGLDELRLAQYLVSWPGYAGDSTLDPSIRRLPPAHTLTVTPARVSLDRYWAMEDVSELRLRHREDYVEALRAHFDEAVRVRLSPVGSVATTLSAGLDSSSVTVTAARQLGDRGRRLLALTSVPTADSTPFTGSRIGDELPLARVTAACAGNVDLVPVDARGVSPITAIRWGLDAFGEPTIAAASQYWLKETLRVAREHGCDVLLIGQSGNAAFSWTGDPLSQPLGYGLRTLGARELVRERLKRRAPTAVLAMRARQALGREWYRNSAIQPELAERLDLLSRRLRDPEEVPRSPLAARLAILKPDRSFVGHLWAASGMRYGIDVRDPTADVRLVSFMLSVPDRVFIDPITGTDRWLAREAMSHRLPDAVRLNTRRGRQAADVVPRLRACAEEVEEALEELDDGAAAAYVDVGYMRDVWRMVQRDDTPEATRKATTVLTRGIMAGLYVNSVGSASPTASMCPSAHGVSDAAH